MRIWERIILGFIFVIIIMIIVDVNALKNNIAIINHIDELEHSKRIELTESNKVAYLIQRIKSNQRRLFLDINAKKSSDKIASTRNEIETNIFDLLTSIKAMNEATQTGHLISKNEEGRKEELEELILIDSLSVLSSEFIADVKKTFELQDTGNINKAEHFFEYTEEPVSVEIQDLVSLIVKNDEEEIAWAINQLSVKVNKTIKLGIYLTLLSILLSVAIGLYIARSISKPLYKLIYGTKEIGKGNLETTVNLNTKGELGLLADSFNDMGKELKNRIEAINRLNTQLEESNQTKDKYFSIIAHDLRNPFNVILGFSDVLVEHYKDFDEDQRQDIIQELNKSSKVIYDLLENLLNWSRSQSGIITISQENLNLNSIVKNSIASYKGNAEQKQIKVENIVPEKVNVYADKFTLRVILNNILNNAIKFTPDGGTVLVSANKNEDEIEVSIKDSGIGMSQKIIDNLLQSKKIDSTPGTHDEKGTGLGVALIKDFIKKNNGRLAIYSTSGKGTDFRFTLPTSDKTNN